LAPYWDKHPDWTFEQVEALYVQVRHNLFEQASA